MSTVRLRRLTADNTKLQDYVRKHPRVRMIQAEGEPPERYQLEYRIKSLRMVEAGLQLVQSHIVEIVLPRNYPRTPPQCRMLSPVFHPNIAPHAICVGDHWSAGESLESIVIRIGEMLAYQSYNVKSPLNGEAARWVEQNKDRVPLDTVSLLPEEGLGGSPVVVPVQAPKSAAQAISAAAPFAAASEPTANEKPQSAAGDPSARTNPVTREPVKVRVSCPNCATAYKVWDNIVGQQVRCQNCWTMFSCEPTSSKPDDN
jgi:predicted Zn finger-like uncharacterized protein